MTKPAKHIHYQNTVFYDGDKITGFIKNNAVSGHLSIDDYDIDKTTGLSKRAYFCQEIECGSRADDKKGHAHSWAFLIKDDGSATEQVILLTNKSVAKTEITLNHMVKTITNAFKSKENKALEHFGYGSTCELNESGMSAFLSYIFETGNTLKESFFTFLIEQHAEATKK